MCFRPLEDNYADVASWFSSKKVQSVTQGEFKVLSCINLFSSSSSTSSYSSSHASHLTEQSGGVRLLLSEKSAHFEESKANSQCKDVIETLSIEY